MDKPENFTVEEWSEVQSAIASNRLALLCCAFSTGLALLCLCMGETGRALILGTLSYFCYTSRVPPELGGETRKKMRNYLD